MLQKCTVLNPQQKKKNDVACASLRVILSGYTEQLEMTWENVCLKAVNKKAWKK